MNQGNCHPNSRIGPNLHHGRMLAEAISQLYQAIPVIRILPHDFDHPHLRFKKCVAAFLNPEPGESVSLIHSAMIASRCDIADQPQQNLDSIHVCVMVPDPLLYFCNLVCVIVFNVVECL